MSNNKLRIAIIDKDKCKPKKCSHECKKSCPVNQMGKICIEIEDIAKINEGLCIGCSQCVNRCPFNAIKIVNLPSQIANNLVHSYGENLFKLYKLPNPKVGKIIGILGQNGVGKTTIMNILSGKTIPNFDKLNNDNVIITKEQVLKHVRGTELQKYLKLLYDDKFKINNKPQDILSLVKNNKTKNMKVSEIIIKFKDFGNYNKIIDVLDLNKIFNNTIITLSGGELQKLVCAITLLKEGDVYIFDEPTNYLDIEYRIKIANLIKDLNTHNKYIFVVEHDLSILDFVADNIHIMFGDPGSYGAISTLYSTLEGINIYFDGYIPADNIRFRPEPYKLTDLSNSDITEIHKNNFGIINYEEKIIKFDNYQLTIKEENIPINVCMIIVLGKNGTGKSTYLNYLSDELGFIISHKIQINNNDYAKQKTTVQEVLYNKISKAMSTSSFLSDVINPMSINKIYTKKVKKLSGGELQRLSIALCLGADANIYLIDEPASSLDVESRFIVTRVIKRFLTNNKKIGFIVEHDILLATSLAKETTSKILVFEETKLENGIRYCETLPLSDFNTGMNKFLKSINATFRTDKNNHRPKINKFGSVMDIEQKISNIYYQ